MKREISTWTPTLLKLVKKRCPPRAGRPPSYFFLLFAEIPTFSYFLLKFLLFDARRQEEFQFLHVFVLGCWVVFKSTPCQGQASQSQHV